MDKTLIEFIRRLLKQAVDNEYKCSDRNLIEWIKSECELRRFDIDEVNKAISELIK